MESISVSSVYEWDIIEPLHFAASKKCRTEFNTTFTKSRERHYLGIRFKEFVQMNERF